MFFVFQRFFFKVLCFGSFSCFFCRALIIQFSIIKKKCKTAFLAKFSTVKLKADACSVFLIFISINQQLLSFSVLYYLHRKCKTLNQTKFKKMETKIVTFRASVRIFHDTLLKYMFFCLSSSNLLKCLWWTLFLVALEDVRFHHY